MVFSTKWIFGEQVTESPAGGEEGKEEKSIWSVGIWEGYPKDESIWEPNCFVACGNSHLFDPIADKKIADDEHRAVVELKNGIDLANHSINYSRAPHKVELERVFPSFWNHHFEGVHSGDYIFPKRYIWTCHHDPESKQSLCIEGQGN
jgi:hypothetical protein